MANHQPKPMSAVSRPHRIVGTFDRPLASPASPSSPSPGSAWGFPLAAVAAGGGVATPAVWPGARAATTTRRWDAEYLGLQGVSVSVGVGVGLRTSVWLGFTTWGPVTL